jgi:hypothetical protein
MSKVQTAIGLGFATAALMYVGGCGKSNVDTPAPSPEPTPSVSVIPSPKPTPLTCIISEETGEKWKKIGEKNAILHNQAVSQEARAKYIEAMTITLPAEATAQIVPDYIDTKNFAIVLTQNPTDPNSKVAFAAKQLNSGQFQIIPDLGTPNQQNFIALCDALKNLNPQTH